MPEDRSVSRFPRYPRRTGAPVREARRHPALARLRERVRRGPVVAEPLVVCREQLASSAPARIVQKIRYRSRVSREFPFDVNNSIGHGLQDCCLEKDRDSRSRTPLIYTPNADTLFGPEDRRKPATNRKPGPVGMKYMRCQLGRLEEALEQANTRVTISAPQSHSAAEYLRIPVYRYRSHRYFRD